MVSPVPPTAPQVFYSDCSEQDIAFALPRLRSQANAPRLKRVALTPSRFGTVRRAYIETTEDRAVPLDMQRGMVANTPCQEIRSLKTGHSPFFAAPAALADTLASLA